MSTSQRNIKQAAFELYDNPSRAAAVNIAQRISAHAMRTITPYAKYFDTTHCAVSGSTARGTHIPEWSDFDIGLLPTHDEPFERYKQPFLKFVSNLQNKLENDSTLPQMLATFFKIKTADVRACLESKPLFDNHQDPTQPQTPIDLFTAKFKVGGKSILEVTAGNRFWHRAGLAFYNCYWHRQLNLLSDQDRKIVLSQICLLKRFAREYGPTKEKKFPSSRTFEQLLIQQKFNGSGNLLTDAMKVVLAKPHKKVVKEFLTMPVPYEMLKVHSRLAATTGDNYKTYKHLKKLASAILTNDQEWRGLLESLIRKPRNNSSSQRLL